MLCFISRIPVERKVWCIEIFNTTRPVKGDQIDILRDAWKGNKMLSAWCLFWFNACHWIICHISKSVLEYMFNALLISHGYFFMAVFTGFPRGNFACKIWYFLWKSSWTIYGPQRCIIMTSWKLKLKQTTTAIVFLCVFTYPGCSSANSFGRAWYMFTLLRRKWKCVSNEFDRLTLIAPKTHSHNTSYVLTLTLTDCVQYRNKFGQIITTPDCKL